MSIAEMKEELIQTIKGLDDDRIAEVYDAVHDCLDNDDEWDEPFPLSEIDQAIRESEEGKGIPADEVIKSLRLKYGLGK